MKKRILSFVLSLVLIIGLIPGIPVTSLAAESDDPFQVVVSIEGLTLGQGIYYEPEAYTLDEINELIATQGYEPYTEENLTAGIATLAFMIDHNLEYEMTGTWKDNAYLSSIKDLDTGVVNIPSIITENGGPSNDDNTGNDDEYLGEFDYSSMSGWMITVNDFMIDVGCSGWVFTNSGSQSKYVSDLGNTYVVRWQFSVYGYGSDLGIGSDWNTPYFEGANKAPLYAEYAACTDSAKKKEALPVMENLTASQAEVDDALAALTAETPSEEPPAANTEYKAILNATMAQMAATVTEPGFGTGGGEWTVMSLARGGYYPVGDPYFEGYYSRIVDTVKETAAEVDKNGALSASKSTENSRLIIALSSIGKDPANVGGVDLIEAYSANGFKWVKNQGLNGPVFALIALDSNNYETTDSTLRQQCIDYILESELEGGGWALFGSAADPDMTGMALQALAKYKEDEEVAAAGNRGFDVLSNLQNENGSYEAWGSISSESLAQVIVACTAWGINPDTDSRFVKNGNSALDALLTFYLEDQKGFAHILEDTSGAPVTTTDSMATDQSCYALVSYDRLVTGRNSLYDMTDVEKSEAEPSELTATLTLPEKVENLAGTTFNAVVNLNGFMDDNRLLDCIVTIPEGVEVTDVTMGSRIGGGEVSWFAEEETGKLRIVYFDAQNGNAITDSGKGYPLELMTIGLKLNKTLDQDSVSMAITGMTLKSDSETQTIINTANASDSAALVQGLSYSVMALYTGDDVDLIPSTKTAIVVAVTGLDEGTKLTYQDGEDTIAMQYNAAVTAKTGVSTYVAMIDSDKALDGFVEEDNYTIGSGNAETLTFGDTNQDGVINAQDALNSVSFWLRKTDAPNDKEILAVNVTGDSRINTFDALGIVEYFVDGSDFAVVNRAATVKNMAE
ncbi:MAG: hypothetical protein PUB22_05450 [Clostridiales bacterium]|nr:hypothetical protein [Clostridiales bacterium]